MTTVTTLSVAGMTCSHCVSAVSQELKAVPGVHDVSVELRNGGTSSVRVMSDAALPEAALREAVDEAGYDVTGVDVLEDALAAQMAHQAPARQATHTLLPVVEAGGAAPSSATHATPSGERHHHGEAHAEPAGHAGCACGCGGQGRQGLGIGLPIVPL
jgi:copper chaperone CopZ